MGSRFRSSDGDWICTDPECANLNFARRNACNRCGKEKETFSRKKQIGVEIGKAAAEKSRGLFSADDWQCTKCGNVNWARRQQCNMCNAPKFGEVEERTGYGGGYNDRGVVEYIRRDESDDEYDEFGRKKKKFRKATSTTSGPVEKVETIKAKAKTIAEEEAVDTAKVKAKENDLEDDEDEEDEGDLSKYDLSGWGDEDNNDEDGNNGEDIIKTEAAVDRKETKMKYSSIDNSNKCDLPTSTISPRSSRSSSYGERHCSRNSNSSGSPNGNRTSARDRSRSPISNQY